MGLFLRDLRYGLRMLGKFPGFAAIAILTLALGIGANVAIYSFVDELWLRPIPVLHVNRLVRIFTSDPPGRGEIERRLNSYPDYVDLKNNLRTLSGLALLERRGALYDDGAQNNLVTAAVISDGFFEVLQPSPAFGRVFTESELKSPQSFWQRLRSWGSQPR
jgi:MacB-like periplasmic core domain